VPHNQVSSLNLPQLKLVELKTVSAGYGHELALKDVNFTVYDRDFIGVIGPNGGGKTTLVKIILGLIKPLAGTVISANEGVQANGFVGYLPQMSRIDQRFPITVRDVAIFIIITKVKRIASWNCLTRWG
jgi:zinc transport system ATP-binding protein